MIQLVTAFRHETTPLLGPPAGHRCRLGLSAPSLCLTTGPEWCTMDFKDSCTHVTPEGFTGEGFAVGKAWGSDR
jgi:hypothetical protein